MTRVLYRLRDRRMFRAIMETPGRGAPYSVRALADAARVPAATVGHLLAGRTARCEMDAAHAIAEALGVAVLVLFTPPVYPNQTGTDVEQIITHERMEERACLTCPAARPRLG